MRCKFDMTLTAIRRARTVAFAVEERTTSYRRCPMSRDDAALDRASPDRPFAVEERTTLIAAAL